MVARYATQPFAGQSVTIMPGTLKDTIAPASDAAVIALWPGNFTAAQPVAGGTVTGVMFQYLAAYPAGPQLA